MKFVGFFCRTASAISAIPCPHQGWYVCLSGGCESANTTHVTKWESNTARQVRATLATRCGERVVTPGRKNCLFIGAPEEEQRCKVGGLAALTWIPGKLPGYRGDMEELMPAAMPKAEEEVKTAQI